jgi:L-ascorbate metabolism protein UlaG (beta-lactamase superfamily)
MKVTYLGHASFKIESSGKTVFIDPWLNCPTSPIKVDDVDAADIVLVTHDHGDHGFSEGVEICKKTDAFLVAINELGLHAKELGVKNVHTLNIGGSVTVASITVTLVQAFHSATRGAPTGFIVQLPTGTIYHPGDTGVFSDMALFKEIYTPDVFLAPVGSYYVMDELQAAVATRLVGPKVVIPMHFDTFPVIEADIERFKQLVAEKAPGVSVEVMAPGDSQEIRV